MPLTGGAMVSTTETACLPAVCNEVGGSTGAVAFPFHFGTNESFTDGHWHLIDVTYDGTNVTVYLDGSSLGIRVTSTIRFVPQQGGSRQQQCFTKPLLSGMIGPRFCSGGDRGTIGTPLPGPTPARLHPVRFRFTAAEVERTWARPL
jgi:hypothetical protein